MVYTGIIFLQLQAGNIMWKKSKREKPKANPMEEIFLGTEEQEYPPNSIQNNTETISEVQH